MTVFNIDTYSFYPIDSHIKFIISFDNNITNRANCFFNVNIDNIFKNYYFVLEDNTIIKNNSILIHENKFKKDNNDYKIFIQS